LFEIEASHPGDDKHDILVREEAGKCLVTFFEALLDSLRPTSAQNIYTEIVGIISFILDEGNPLSINVLEAIMKRLLTRDSNPRAWEAANEILQRTSDKIHPLIAGLACSALQRASVVLEKEAKKAVIAKQKKGDIEEDDFEEEEMSDADGSDLSGDLSCSITFCAQPEAAHALAFELATACPPALDRVIPFLSSKLKAFSRGHAILTLGRLFSLPSPTSSSSGGGGGGGSRGMDSSLSQPLGVRFATAFASWLGRFRDVDVKIRSSICHLGGQVLRVHSSLAPQVADELSLRIADLKPEVRLQAVKAVCDSVYDKLDHVPISLIKGTAKRKDDKEVEIRREAITGLAQAYRFHIEKIWMREVEFSSANVWDATRVNRDGVMIPPERGSLEAFEPTDAEMAIIQKIFWIPSLIMNCYAHNESEVRQRVVQIMDTVLLPESLEEETRAHGLAAIFTTFDDEAKLQFFRMQRDRCRAQLDLSRLVHIRDELKKADVMQSAILKAELSRIVLQLSSDRAASLSTAGRNDSSSSSHRTALALTAMTEKVPDNRVFMRLETIADPCTSVDAIRTAKEDLLQRVKMAVANAANSSAPAGGSGRSSIKGERSSSSSSDSGDGMSFLVDSLKALLRRTQMATVTVGMIPRLTSLLMQQIARDNLDDAKNTLQLLTGMATFFPGIFAKIAGNNELTDSISPCDCLLSLLHSNEPVLLVGALRTLTLLTSAVVFPPNFDESTDAAENAKTALITLCTQGSVEVAKHAVYASLSLFNVGDETDYTFTSAGKSLPDDNAERVREYALAAFNASREKTLKATSTGKKGSTSSSTVGTVGTAVAATDPFFEKLIARLSAPKPLSGSNVYLHSHLASIGALAMRAPWLYAKMDGLTLSPSSSTTTSTSAAGSAKSSSAAGGGSAPVPPGRVTQWLLNFITSTPSAVEESTFPTRNVSSASRRAAMAKKRAAALAEDETEEDEHVVTDSKVKSLLSNDAEGKDEEEEEEEEDDDDDDEGFGRKKKKSKKTKGKGSSKSKSTTAANAAKKRARDEKPSSSDVGGSGKGVSGGGGSGKVVKSLRGDSSEVVISAVDESSSSSSMTDLRPLGYKGFEPSGCIISRILAMNAVSSIARGLLQRSISLVKLALTAETDKTATTNSRSSVLSSAGWHSGVLAISRAQLLTKSIEAILKVGGDLTMLSSQSASSTSGHESDSPFLYSVKDSYLGVGTSSASSRMTPTRVTQSGDGSDMPSIDAATLRIACFCIAVRLAARPPDSTPQASTIDTQVISISLWKRLFFSSTQDIDIDVREAALSHVRKLLKRCLLPLRYVIFPIMSAIDPQKRLRRKGKEVLYLAASVYSKAASQQAQAGSSNTAAQRAVLGLRFEFSLSFALCLLSSDIRRIPQESITNGTLSAVLKKAGDDMSSLFDPSFSPFVAHAQCLKILVDATLAAASGNVDGEFGHHIHSHNARAEAGSLSIMHTLYTILCDHEDLTQKGGSMENIRAFKNMNTVLFCLLKQRTKDQAGFDKYPGSIPLPSSMLVKKNV
jgi:hypothetical protein